MLIRRLEARDWTEVAAIYAAGIATGAATFETEVPTWEAWAAAHPVALVAEEAGRVVGWAALSPASSRECYAGVMEESVYVAPEARGRGVGAALLTAVCDEAERDGVWTIEAGVFPENEASLRVHAACGFRVVGVRERIGRLNGAWRDTVLLERRMKEKGS